MSQFLQPFEFIKSPAQARNSGWRLNTLAVS
jgi:hypothetical protein